MFQNVLVGADNSATAMRAVETAVEMAQTLGSKLHIVTAYQPDSVKFASLLPEFYVLLPPDLEEASAANLASALLEQLRVTAKNANVEAEIHLTSGEPAAAIVEVANRVGADLIVVGNKGMRGAKRVLGSVPNSIAHRAECAVLIVDTSEAR